MIRSLASTVSKLAGPSPLDVPGGLRTVDRSFRENSASTFPSTSTAGSSAPIRTALGEGTAAVGHADGDRWLFCSAPLRDGLSAEQRPPYPGRAQHSVQPTRQVGSATASPVARNGPSITKSEITRPASPDLVARLVTAAIPPPLA